MDSVFEMKKKLDEMGFLNKKAIYCNKIFCYGNLSIEKKEEIALKIDKANDEKEIKEIFEKIVKEIACLSLKKCKKLKI